MAGYKVPKLVVFGPIPKTSTGKIQKFALREAARTAQERPAMTYAAPLDEMRFVLNHTAGMPEIATLPGCEEAGPELVDAILTEAGRFAAEVLAPLNATGDRQGCRWTDGKVATPDGFAAAYRQFTEAGWHAMPAGTDIGGQGMPALVSSAVAEMWKSANLAFSLCQMLTMGAVEALAHHASDELKARYLPKMVAGTWTGTMNLTEPQAGSDLAAVRTRAEPEGDQYRLFGSKIFITWGEHDMAENIIHLVLARLPDAPPGTRGISLFLVPKFLVNPDGSLGARNDLICSSIEHKLGIHGSPTAVMSYGDKDGAIGYLVGEANQGLEYMFTMMNHARLNVGLRRRGDRRARVSAALAYARDRVQGRPIGQCGERGSDHPSSGRAPDADGHEGAHRGDARAGLSARPAAWTAPGIIPMPPSAARNQARVELLTPSSRAGAPRSRSRSPRIGVQVHGGMGFIEETGAAQHLRDARITTIYEGTTGIQANDLIGRKLARDKGVERQSIARRHAGRAEALASSNDADLSAIGLALEHAIEAFAEATSWLLAHHDSRPREAAAGAVPYLMLAGTVTGGWQMARAARIAGDLLAIGEEDAAFLQAKIATARFYAEHVLPEAAIARDEITAGAGSTLALEAALA